MIGRDFLAAGACAKQIKLGFLDTVHGFAPHFGTLRCRSEGVHPIDHSSGKAYNYPEWLQVVFGRILVFDRTEHEDGVPMTGKEASPSDKAQTEVAQSQ